MAAETYVDPSRMAEWARTQYLDKYAWKDSEGNPSEDWPDTAERVVRHVLGALGYGPKSAEYQALTRYIAERKFIPGGRYLASAGRPYHQVNNCFLYRCEDSRVGWADLVRKSILALSSGGGIGIVYSDVRPSGSVISTTRGTATGPLSPAQMVNEVARQVHSGGYRRSAIWGGLHWSHPDVRSWITVKDWDPYTLANKERDPLSPAPLDMTNISVILDDEFFAAFRDVNHPRHVQATEVYWATVSHMLKHGEPGFSVNTGRDNDECLRNACTEITSEDDSDVCNLGSLNLARITSQEELREVTRLATLFLLAGTVYSDVPHDEVLATREKNRRLGLGLMGVHEWLLARGYRYEVSDELHEWLAMYRDVSRAAATEYADRHELSVPVKVRAVAPTGTIGIVGETTTSAEPVLYVACKRWFLDGDKTRRFQYVLDPTVERMRIQHGLDPRDIETAYSLAYEPERRIAFQADVQDYIDHAVSSTINLPAPVTEPSQVQAFGETLMKYLPRLRGITCYPNGARAGQPFEEVSYEEASSNLGVTFDDDRAAQCSSGVCGV